MILILLFASLFVSSYTQGTGNFTLVPTPGRLPNGVQVYVSAYVGDPNITLTCALTNATGNEVPVSWILTNYSTMMTLDFAAMSGLSSQNEALYTNDTDFQHTIILADFTADWNRISLTCRPESYTEPSQTFVLGIPNNVSLVSPQSVNATEGNNVTVNLAAAGNDPFPPYDSAQWWFNGQLLMSTDTLSLTDYMIIIRSIQRNQSGVYQLVVTQQTRSFNTSITVNVQYPPEGTPANNTVVYGELGENITLTFFYNLAGNPFPSTTWTLNGSSIMVNTGRYQSPNPSQLNITDITRDVYGTYVGMTSNGIDNVLLASVMLIEARQSGPPTNLRITNITHNSAYLWWNEPIDLGVPSLTHYMVTLTPAVVGSPYTTSSTELSLDDLYPTIDYNVTVVGVSSVFPNGGYSATISFSTVEGPPEFNTADITPANGNITFVWQLRHTGGLHYNDVSVRGYCSSNMDYMLGSGSSGSGSMDDPNTFLYSCDTQCITAVGLNGATSLGPVTAGTTYYCSFVVSNALGDATETRNVIPVLGKPSRPIVTVSSTDQGSINVVIRCQYTGIFLGQGIGFNIRVKNEQMNSVFNKTETYINYVNDTDRMVSVNVSGDQLYYIDVTVMNTYGVSELVMSGPINVTATSPPSTTSESNTRLLIIIIAASVGGLLIAVVFISIIICICACCIRKKKRTVSVTFTSNAQTWKRTQSDAKYEMSQRKRYN